MSKLQAEDTLYITRKAAREDALKAAQSEGRVSFSYADESEVREKAGSMVKMFMPTLKELKDR